MLDTTYTSNKLKPTQQYLAEHYHSLTLFGSVACNEQKILL